MRKLSDIYSLIRNIQNECVITYDVFQNQIFTQVDFSIIKSVMPSWIIEGGNSTESPITKAEFERLVSLNKNILTHKVLYLYDCDMLLASLQDRLDLISGLIEQFYKRLPYESKYRIEDFNSASIPMSTMDAGTFAYLNSIFIFLGSSFDILTKIAFELHKINSIDFSNYPKMVSRNILFGDRKKINQSLIKNSIFEYPIIIKRIESIRNRIIHDGSFDFRQKIYSGYIANDGNGNEDIDMFILFPDFINGVFVSYVNRRNFYVNSNRINLSLPQMLYEVLSLILKTIEQINSLYKKPRFSEENTLEIYNKEITQWYNSISHLGKIKKS